MQAPSAGRAYDALYDPLFTVSGARDHYRAQTTAGGFQVERCPDFPHAFSVLPHYPATTYRLKNSDRVPAFIDRQFHEKTVSPAEMHARSQASAVNGTTRPLYFRRPMLAAPDPVIVKQAQLPPLPVLPPAPQEPKSKTTGTQSDYRESEAQTTAWEPGVRIPEESSLKQQVLSAKYNCDGPELLYLKDLKFGDGLPPGLQEVRRIEKMREKRAFEATLPPLDDLSRLPLRQKMLEEWEEREWAEREEEILSVQQERLQLLGQALNLREEEYDMETLGRIKDRKAKLLHEKGGKFAEMQASRIKTMRQLIEARKFVEKPRKLHRPDIVERYANFGSSTYAPVQREGRFPETKPQGKSIETEGFQPATLQGIRDLQGFIPKRMLDPIVAVPQKPAKLDYAQRQEAAIQKDLKAINDLLDTAKAAKGRGYGECWPAQLKDGSDTRAVRNKQAVRIQERPETPVLPAPSASLPGGVMSRDVAVVLLQRLLRGRAAQNMMYEGKNRRQELIQELRLAESGAANTARPESMSEEIDQLDIAIGEVISELCVVLAETDEAQRATMLVKILAPPSSKPATPVIVRPTSREPAHAEASASGALAKASSPEGEAADDSAPPPAADAAAPALGGSSAPGPVLLDLELLGITLEEAEVAAVKIQAAMKGRKARKEVAAMREKGAEYKSKILQVVSKAPDLEAMGVSVEEAEAAATKIQAAMKGRAARKEVAALKEKKSQESQAAEAGAEAGDQPETEAAADAAVPIAPTPPPPRSAGDNNSPRPVSGGRKVSAGSQRPASALGAEPAGAGTAPAPAEPPMDLEAMLAETPDLEEKVVKLQALARGRQARNKAKATAAGGAPPTEHAAAAEPVTDSEAAAEADTAPAPAEPPMYLEAMLAETPDLEEKVIKLQALARGRQARNKAKATAAGGAPPTEQDTAAEPDAEARAASASAEPPMDLEAMLAETPDLEEKVIKLQALARGRQARQKGKAAAAGAAPPTEPAAEAEAAPTPAEPHMDLEAMLAETPDLEEKVIKLQALARGRQARNKRKATAAGGAPPTTQATEAKPDAEAEAAPAPAEPPVDLEAMLAETPDLEEKVIKLQALARGRQARNKGKATAAGGAPPTKQVAAADPDADARAQAAADSQAADSRSMPEETIGLDLNDPELQAKVLKIQALQRGRQARLRVRELQKEKQRAMGLLTPEAGSPGEGAGPSPVAEGVGEEGAGASPAAEAEASPSSEAAQDGEQPEASSAPEVASTSEPAEGETSSEARDVGGDQTSPRALAESGIEEAAEAEGVAESGIAEAEGEALAAEADADPEAAPAPEAEADEEEDVLAPASRPQSSSPKEAEAEASFADDATPAPNE